jgi:branched-chain amino acid transport system substrate-binding protein
MTDGGFNSPTRRRVLQGLAGGVVGGLAAPYVAPALAQNNKPLRIALAVCQSGPAGVADHADYLNGAKMAADEINAAGGVKGRPFKLEVYDIDILTPEGTQTTYRKIAEAKPHASGTAFSLIPLVSFDALSSWKAPHLHGNPTLGGCEAVKAHPEKYGMIFEVCPPENYYGLMFPRFLETVAAGGVWKPVNNKVHIVREALAYNQGIAKACVAALKTSKFELAKITDIQFPVQDWGPVMEELHASGAGSIMIDHWVGAEEAAFCQTFINDPVKGAMVYLQYGPSQPEFLNLAGEAANGFVWSTVIGAYDDKLGAEFRAKYKKLHPGIMGLCYTANAYDAMHILKTAWEKADPEDLAATNQAIRTTTHRGICGAYTFEPGMQAALHYPLQTDDLNKGLAQLFFQVQGGQHKIIEPTQLAETKFMPAPWMAA